MMTTGSFCALLMASALGGCGPAKAPHSQTSLDAPMVAAGPTIRSEIMRGSDAADDCDKSFDLARQLQEWRDCIDAAHSANRQRMGTGFEAFDAGLYWQARFQLATTAKVLKEHPYLDRYDSEHALLVKSALNVEDGNYQLAKSALKLTDQQIEPIAMFGSN